MSILVDLPIVPLTFAHLVVCILPSYSAHGRHWCAPSDTCWSFAGIVGPEREMAADSTCLVPASSLTPPRPHSHFPPHQFAHNLLHHLRCAIPLWIAKYQLTIIANQWIASCPLFVLHSIAFALYKMKCYIFWWKETFTWQTLVNAMRCPLLCLWFPRIPSRYDFSVCILRFLGFPRLHNPHLPPLGRQLPAVRRWAGHIWDFTRVRIPIFPALNLRLVK